MIEKSVGTHGVTERLPQADATDELAAELKINGFTLLESGFSAEFIGKLRSGLDRVYRDQVEEVGGEQILQKMNDADVARCVLAYDQAFLEVATCQPLMHLAARFLGQQFVLLQQNGIINRPDRENYQAKWHRDLSYQHWTTSRPLAINALLCIDQFTTENGATFVLPGTHQVGAFPTDAFALKFERQVAVPAGCFLVLDAMIYHRAGINVSANVRRAVNHVIGLPFMAQQVDLPSALGRAGISPPDDPAVKRYLGYQWSPAADASDWRTRRMT